MTPIQAIAFIKKHGIVLESASGPVPSLAHTIAGAEIKGRWWSHPLGKEIFRITRAVRDSPEILVCRLVAGKITFVHKRIWPALVRAADHFKANQLAQLVEEHTESGKHRSTETQFPRWVPPEVVIEAEKLTEQQALHVLESILR